MKIFNYHFVIFGTNEKRNLIIDASCESEAIQKFNCKTELQNIRIEKISYANIPNRKNAYGEFVVQIYVNGKRQKDNEYFATNFDDALATAQSMITNY